MKNILIITYWSFDDALIQTYTLPYVRMIKEVLPKKKKVFLFTLEQEDKKMSKLEWKRHKAFFLKDNIHLLRFSYSNFGIRMVFKFITIFSFLFFLILTKKISHIHTWCTPAGAIGYLLSIISGKELILDSCEPHAEPMIESGTWERESFKFKLLFWLEKKQVEKATTIIACVPSMKDYIKEKFKVRLDQMYYKPACVDFDLFDVEKSNNKELIKNYALDDKVVGVYAGKFGGSYLKDDFFEFLKEAENYWGLDKFRFILLTSHSKKFVSDLVSQFNINRGTIIQLFVPHKEVPQYLGLADFGITPFIPVPSKRYGSPIKNAEYWAMGLPVIITKNISDDSDIIKEEDIGYVLQNLSKAEYVKGCAKIDSLIMQGEPLLKNKIIEIARKYRDYEIANNLYRKVYS